VYCYASILALPPLHGRFLEGWRDCPRWNYALALMYHRLLPAVVEVVNYIIGMYVPASTPTPAPVALDDSPCYLAGFDAALSSAQCGGNQWDHGAVNCKHARPILQIGSSTVFPIAQAHGFRYVHSMVMPFAKSSGSTLGFKNFLNGGTDISTASRALKQSDYDKADCPDPGNNPGVVDGVAQYECQGRFPFGVLVGRDMLAVIINNDFLTSNPGAASMSSLVLQTTVNNQAYQGTPVTLYVPDALSGTRDFFEEALNVDLSGVPGFVDDVEITDGVAMDPQGLGVAPLAFVLSSSGLGEAYTVVAINFIDPTDPATNPSSYFFTRPLYKYFDKANVKEEVVDFICALLVDEGQTNLVEAVGYVTLSEAEINEITSQPELACADRVNPPQVNFKGVFLEMSFCQDANILSIIGSSTVYPVSLAAARVFPSTMSVFRPASTGSSIGLQDVIASATDIGAASRALAGKDYGEFECDTSKVIDGKAQEPCQGVLPLGIQVGVDNLAVIVNLDHQAVNTNNFFFTVEDLWNLFVGGATWKSVVPQSQCTGAPALFVPDSNSGTHDFMEEALEDNVCCSSPGPGCVFVGSNCDVDITTPGFVNDGDIKAGVAADVCGLGFLGRAFVDDPATAVSIKSATGPVINPFDDDADYALARPLFYYFDSTPDAYDAIINEYLCYVISPAGQVLVETVGYSASNTVIPSSDLFCGFPATVTG